MAENDTPAEEKTLSEVLEEHVRLEVRLSRELAGYKGCWVAVRNHEVVKSADSLQSLVLEVDTDHVDFVLAVPTTRTTAALF
jgi:hypothetical protein